MRRVRRHWWVLGAVMVLVAAGAACSGDDEPDVAGALDGANLTDATANLFGDGTAPSSDQPLAERAAQVADRIATSFEALEGPSARYETTVGAPLNDQVGYVGDTLGHTRAALADVEGAEAMAYALRISWDLADRLGDPDIRLAWVTSGFEPLGPADGQELTTRLDGGDDAGAAEALADARPDLEAAEVIDALHHELAERIPVDPDGDALSTFLTRYGPATGNAEP